MPFRLSGPEALRSLKPVSLRVRERLCEPFRAQADCLRDVEETNGFCSVIGKSVSVRLFDAMVDPTRRLWHGILTNVEQIDGDLRHERIRLTIRPEF